MRRSRRYRGASIFSATGLIAGLAFGAVNMAGATAAPAPTVALPGTASPAATNTPTVGAVPSSTAIDFEVSLNPRDEAGAAAFATAVSTPGTAAYHHYLTAAQWEQRFSPTQGAVASTEKWLAQSGFAVTAVSADRMAISASGTAAQVERAFSTSLSFHVVKGQSLRVATRDLSIPRSLIGIVSGAEGINQVAATPDHTTGAATKSATATTNATNATIPATAKTIPQPPGFRVAPPCSSYFGQKVDTTTPAYGHGYPSPDPYVVCGYTPGQLRSAYSDTGGGTGQTVAIVDAYASPTLLSDTQTYDAQVDPTHILNSSQFSELLPTSFNEAATCDANGWYGEQTLDIEAVHSTAPAAKILYVGAKNCFNTLFDSVRQVVDGHLADVITDSWGDDAGDLLDDAGTRASFDNTAMMAAGTGISLLFSSGDNGDEFATTGLQSADYPASSPWLTAVGGTSLEVGANGARDAEYGWSTARSFLCTPTIVGAGFPGCSQKTLGTWGPPLSDGGSGGGTSYNYPQPAYQKGIVPLALATRNSAAIGDQPMRVEPDISTVGDPGTGFLVGETQTFPNGVYYDTYRIGGTSVASPVFAGIIAVANGKAGTDLGFLNPALYQLDRSDPAAIKDITPPGKAIMARVDYANSIDASQGFLYTTRIVTYEGPETYCDNTGNCATRNNALKTNPGYDSMTGLGSPAASFIKALAAQGS